ncbi:MAG: CPBP family intramembrane metalloprotease [Clostridia bacterium]|nr:CPBP family intramembrane metalloprotease [Clostridia bacterium]
MKAFIKSYWKTLLFFGMMGLVGGFFTGLFIMDSYPVNIQQQLINELNTSGLGVFPPHIVLGVVSAIQATIYGVVLGAIGIWLGKKTGLWKDERTITKRPLLISIIISVLGGLAMILPDMLFFGKCSDVIMDSYATKPTIPYILATVTYGAVIEEVMLRLFWLSLIAFALHKLFGRKNEAPTVAILIIANLIAAILFAVSHLPATEQMLGLTPMLVFRCFLLNGGFGLMFGWLYRKYGLRYAMIAHGGCHIVSKLIWILFI